MTYFIVEEFENKPQTKTSPIIMGSNNFLKEDLC